MKILISAILTLLVATSAFAETIKVSVPEMECGGCSSAIKDRLKQEAEITEIKTDTDTRIVTITTKEAATLTDDKVKALIKDAGFEVKSIERS